MSQENGERSIIPRKELQERILEYDLAELELLLVWLKTTVKERKQAVSQVPIPLKKGREVVKTLESDKTTYRLEMVKCGKKKCKCTKGKLHGPYWYAYHWNGKKLISTYIGKTLPEPDEIALNSTESQSTQPNPDPHPIADP